MLASITAAIMVGFVGQSNNLVHNLTAVDLPAGYTPTPMIQIYNSVTKVVEMYNPGVNAGTTAQPGAWGPEFGFAQDWLVNHPGEELIIVKTAKGSTGLAEDPNELDWSQHSRNEMFDQATANFQNTKAFMLAQGVDAKLSTVFVMQGEQDAVNAAKAAAYGDNGIAFVAAARSAWGDASTAFVFAKINTAAGLQYDDEVRAGQDAIDAADPNTYTLDTVGFATQADHLHFSAAGAISLGHADYSVYAAPQSTAGTPSDELIQGRGGNDYLHGGDGNDTIYGGDGFDDIHGNTGNDLEFGGNGSDWVVGGQGADTIFGEDGDDLVYGNMGSDSLSGGTGADTLRGGQDDDVINGDDGNDWIFGDLGNDTMTGGAGADTFFFSANSGQDRIMDFNASAGDHVSLDHGAAYSVSYAGADTVLTIDSGGVVTLVGVHLTGSDWISA